MSSDEEYARMSDPDFDDDLSDAQPVKKKAKSRSTGRPSQRSSNKEPPPPRPFDIVGGGSESQLKRDHVDRPLWVDPHRRKIILEHFHPLGKSAQDFLVAIAEPVSRPQFIHEYKYNEQSLLSAQSVGLNADDIIRTLDKFSKTTLPTSLKEWIVHTSKQFGKVKLLLKENKYFIQSPDSAAINRLLKDEVIGKLVIQGTSKVAKEKANQAGLVLPGTKDAAANNLANRQQQPQKPSRDSDSEESDEDEFGDGGITNDDMERVLKEDDDDDEEEVERNHQFEIESGNVTKVKERCLEIQLPITEEYDFRNDRVNPNLEIDLKPAARIRDYQEKALSKMFGNGRAKSGIIVLPCGSGKTLVGITAACTVRKGIIVLCTSSMSVVQWKSEFCKWSNIDPEDIAVFTSDHKDKFNKDTGIIISTYPMVTQTGKRSHDSQKMMDFIQGREWGLMLLDEVHVAPAGVFRKVTHQIATHSKLGLTATLLREDDKIQDLNYLIGPKLYEANWMELSEQGHIAKVQCAEVWCPMTAEFYTEYIKAKQRQGMLLYTMNPKKFQACQFLIDYHEKRGDKIIVFSDNVFTLKQYASALGKFMIYGETAQAERQRILENFQHNPQINTIFLSKIGDTSLDLPEATCLIQISSHFGSRRQEAQRLGRILRAKRRNDEGFNAFFYSLVSKDTSEMAYSAKRQAFLVDQGYAFKVITHLAGIENLPGLKYATPKERADLLVTVLNHCEKDSGIESIDDDLFSSAQDRGARAGAAGSSAAQRKQMIVRRMAGTLGELSGGQDMAYMEASRATTAQMRKDQRSKNPLIRKMQNERKRAKAVRDAEINASSNNA